MKNKKIFFTLTLLFFCNIAAANSFKFETKNIEIYKEKNQIVTGKGKVFSSDNNYEINANKFEYSKNLDILKADGDGKVIINSKNLEIKFDKAIFDQKNSTIRASGNVKIKQISKNFLIESEEILYQKLIDLISSNTRTILKDKSKNIYAVDSFKFEIKKNLLKVINLEFQDKEKNTIKTKLAYINTLSGKLFGKDVNVNFNNSSFNKDNQPRLKANSIIRDENTSELTKGVFTTCKKRNNCPPWEVSAEKIQHNTDKKIINYKNAFLKVYDVPVMYFPKFFHPDPTVKRQSGFLIPTVKNSSNSDNFLNTPYFFAIAENKDATFSPRFYPKEKILLQTELRQTNFNSNHIADLSYYTEKGKNSKNHFFYEYDNEFIGDSFETNRIDLKIQQTSNDTYLKTDKLKSDIINDYNILENSLGLNMYSDDLTLSFNANVYEDLDKNKSDRYEFILPRINLVKNINNKTSLNGNFSFESQALVRNYNTNVYERNNINDLVFKSYPKITSGGFYNNYEFLVKNSNMNNKNSTYKNNENIYLSGIFQYNSTLPLIKDDEAYKKILKPKISLRLAPNHTKDNRNVETRIDINNIYSMNRLTDNSTEGGFSVTYGGDYSIFDNKNSNEILNLKFANNLRFEENDDLSNSNQIGEKTSNIFSEIIFNPNEYITTKYNNSLESNLKDISYENLIAEFRINNLVTKFDYLNENNTTLKNSYLTNETTYSIDKFYSLSYSTRKNKTTDLTEYYNFMYQYKNDCLAASIEYNKDYYSDRELKPNESVFFKLTIIPLGETSSPDLKK